jgi:putative NADH-flavin reductase
MKVLVLGATGSTGSLVVQHIIKREFQTKIVVRDIEKVPADIRNNKLVECIVGNVIEFDKYKNIALVKDCDAVISCLGHNITFKGILGKPRLLVADSIKNICDAINESKEDKVKLILMNTTANRNKKIKEKYSFKDRIIISLLSFIVPPQNDNEKAAEYLSYTIGDYNKKIDWIAVRPDTLINDEKVSKYELHESPKQSPVFNAGKTSRINVAYFMVELLSDEVLWNKWKYKMPVIYNIEN